MISNPPYGFKYFKNIMIKHFLKNSNWYLKKCISLNEIYQNKLLKFHLYNIDVKCKYDIILQKFSDLIIKYKNIKKRKYNKKIKIDTNIYNEDNMECSNSDDDSSINDVSMDNDSSINDVSMDNSSDDDIHMIDEKDYIKNKKCNGYLKNGNKCSFNAQKGNNYCKFHINQKITI
jgi:hypothetical protein